MMFSDENGQLEFEFSEEDFIEQFWPPLSVEIKIGVSDTVELKEKL
jgi:hypothetical protein